MMGDQGNENAIDEEISLRKSLDFDEMLELPKTVWHYTNINSLLGILNSKIFFLTDIQYLNDRQELVHFYDHIKKKVGIYFSTGDKQDRDKYWLPNEGFDGFGPIKDKAFKDKFFRLLERCHDSILRSNICVGSFSEQDDLLSQWRAYGSKKSGVSIGFDLKTLQNVAENQGLAVRKCKYLKDDDASPIYWVTRFIRDTQDKLDDIEDFQLAYLQLAAKFKHNSFSEESEWRIISKALDLSTPGIDYRATKSNLIPYFKMSFNKFAGDLISDVKVGPSQHQSMVEKSIEAIKQKLGYRFDVSKSSIPYRSDI